MGDRAHEDVEQVMRFALNEPARLLGCPDQLRNLLEEVPYVFVNEPVHTAAALAGLVRHEPVEGGVLGAEADEILHDQAQLGRRVDAPESLETRAIHVDEALIQ